MKSKPGLAACWFVVLAQGAVAQSGWRSVAVPYYTPPAYVQGELSAWYLPRARDFATTSAALTQAVQAHCNGAPLAAARNAWVGALEAWSRLSASAIGPLIDRRSARRIDFAPTRPELVNRAIALDPNDRPDLDNIGSAAKGFGALELLLWPSAPQDPARCRYAVQVAADIAHEADELAGDFAALQKSSADEADETQTATAMAEAVNQWLGGVERLRVQALERPLAEARSRGTAPRFGRDASGASAAERAARWQALRALAVHEGHEAPSPGAGLVPLEPYLRGKGLNPLADRLVAAVRRADLGLAAAQRNAPAAAHAAARTLAALHTLVGNEVLPALDIRPGFSDADGD